MDCFDQDNWITWIHEQNVQIQYLVVQIIACNYNLKQLMMMVLVVLMIVANVRYHIVIFWRKC